MRLHLLGLPHTVSSEEFSHCAYTGKCLRFPRMMAPHGYEIVHYGVEGAEVDCERVDVLSRAEFEQLRGPVDERGFVGDIANVGHPLYQTFNARLRELLLKRVQPHDLVLLPFGYGHGEAVAGFDPNFLLESGIGYPTLYPGAAWRIFESNAWLHWHHGKDNGRNGKNYEWVIPNYFDTDAWAFNPEGVPGTVAFLGRICDVKGLRTVVEVARARPDLKFVICGQGNPEPYLTAPNIAYRPPITGRDRSAYLGNAAAVIMPTQFTEPFGGVAVEAMLCGTPVLSTTYGAFTETIEDEVTGFRCHTLGDFLAALERVPELDRRYIADRARRLYGFERVGRMYARAIDMIADLRSGGGWYSHRSAFGPVEKAVVDRESAWQRAQQAELRFHQALQFRENERTKRRQYAGMLGIDEAAVRGKKILDVGCGPESLLLEYVGAYGEGSTAVDPLRFTDEDEARYRAAGIERLIQPAETPLDGEFDEAWCYNVLQHVLDPERVLAQLKARASVVRIWEWCNAPTDTLHLHVLTAERICRAMAGWEVVHMTHGQMFGQSECYGEYIAAVFRAPGLAVAACEAA